MSSHLVIPFLIVVIFFSNYERAVSQDGWSVRYAGMGTFSSPRVTDLNGDGIGDVIIGAGREEFHHCDSAVMAIDGANGELLWHVSAIDQIFGSATLKDLNNDGIEDVLIGGRSAELIAINGKTGKVIWRFDKKTRSEKWYNFYNPQFVSDLNNDGINDILISNGGDVMAEPYDTNRPAGSLNIISAKDGKLIAKALMPDNKEIYMSIATLPIDNGKNYKIIFGTGGETVGGNLFVGYLSDVLKEDLSPSTLLDSSPANGYIGPPVWIDITHDGISDILVNAVEGKLLAFDGSTLSPIWSVKIPDTEAYSSIAPGLFTGDDTPDFFLSYASGKWPNLEWSKQFLVDGSNGKIEYMDSLGHYQTSTPVVIDLDNNGRDEAILSVNIHVVDEYELTTLYNILAYIDFGTKEVVQIGEMFEGNNISSTPWIGDMDNDGILDIVYCHATNLKKAYTFDGMQVNRIKTNIPVTSHIKWGAYMGSNYDGIFQKD